MRGRFKTKGATLVLPIMGLVVALFAVFHMTGCAEGQSTVHTLVYEEAKVMDLPFNDETLRCICVFTKYTNGSTGTAIPADKVTVKTFQDGVELSPWVFTGQRTENYFQCDTSIQAGITADVIWIFELRSDTSKIDIEISNGESYSLEWRPDEVEGTAHRGVSGIPNEYIGIWKANVVKFVGDGVKTYETKEVAINEDGTGYYGGHVGAWSYSEGTEQLILTIETTGNGAAFDIDTEDGKTVLRFFQDTYYYETDFVEKDAEPINEE